MMIGHGKSFLQRSIQQQQSYGALVSSATRSFAGGAVKKKALPSDTTDFDLVLIGKFFLSSLGMHGAEI